MQIQDLEIYIWKSKSKGSFETVEMEDISARTHEWKKEIQGGSWGKTDI